MRISKANKERILRIQVSLFDCHYMIQRLRKEGKQSDLENWRSYRNDLIELSNKIKSGKA